MLTSVVKLEKEAMRSGYSLAISFVSGSCQLCDKCQTENTHMRSLRHGKIQPRRSWSKREENRQERGIQYIFPFPKNPESFALLLID